MKLTFLGTGGGRVNLIKQFLQTGGFRIDSESANIHVDPGPGALIHSIKNNINPFSLDAIIVTHYHIDHCNDAALLIEAMTDYTFSKKGIFIGSKFTVKGDDKGDGAVSGYHLSKPGIVYSAEFGEKKKFKTKKGSFEIEIIKTKHDEPSAFGFKLFLDGKTIGYTGDSEFFKILPKKFSGCDYLIINCLKPTADGVPDHLKISDAIEIIKGAEAKKVFISHIGIKLLDYGLDRTKKEIENSTGAEVIIPKDNQVFEL